MNLTKKLNKFMEWAIWKMLLSDISIKLTTCGRMSITVFIGYLKISDLLKHLNKYMIYRDRRNKTDL